MKKALVVFNPTAGIKNRQDIEGMTTDKLTKLGYQVDLFYLNHSFEDRIDDHNFSETKLVVAVGGDGTVKVAARTIMQKKLEVPLAILPFGSANVIASAAGIPINIKGALKLLGNISRTTAIDVGVINKKHYFLVGFSIGYISKVVTSATRDLKNRFGMLGYLLVLLFNRIKIREAKFIIKANGDTFHAFGNSLVVFNALNYYGIKTKKLVSFSDGVFNLYVFTNRTFLSLLKTFLMMFLYQEPAQNVLNLDSNYFEITLKNPSRACQIDGDYITLPNIIKIKTLPRALRIIVGKEK